MSVWKAAGDRNQKKKNLVKFDYVDFRCISAGVEVSLVGIQKERPFQG